MTSLWEKISNHPDTYRMKVPRGWLVCIWINHSISTMFYLDLKHKWKV